MKNPKKVEAGRKGAAARKSKEERLLGELRVAKESVREVQQQKRHEESEPPNRAMPKPVDHPQNTDWIPWIIGAAVLAGVFMLQRRSSEQKIGAGCLSIADTRTTQLGGCVEGTGHHTSQPTASKLKDSFYME